MLEPNKACYNDIYDLNGNMLGCFSCDICNKSGQCHRTNCAIEKEINESGLVFSYQHVGFDEFGYNHQYFVKNNPENCAIINKIRNEFCR